MSDLIRREDVLRLAECGKLLSGFYGERAKDIIKAIPSKEPKVGRWEENEHGLKCCSVCRKRPLQICYFDINYGGYKGKDILSEHCPNCGARMERSE